MSTIKLLQISAKRLCVTETVVLHVTLFMLFNKFNYKISTII